jgi:glycosyltransferase involved in cell wall biosynthesis
LKGSRSRLFWCHPMLMDYRVGLFERMAERHDVRFFFQQRSDVPNPFESVYGRDDVIRSENAPPEDIREIRRGIRWADVFVSSFIRSVYTRRGLFFAKLLGRRVIVWEEINDQTIFEVRSNDPRYGISGMFRALLGGDGGLTLRNFRRVWTFRLQARLVDAFFVQGESQVAALERLGVPSVRIFRSNEYPGQDYGALAAKPLPLPLPDSTKVVLFLGRLIEIKGVEYLLRAFARLSGEAGEVSLLVAGEGPDRPRLEELGRSLGLANVRFLGPVTDLHEKAFLFRRASVVVVPSVSLHGAREGGPLVVLEALSAGTPVVGTDVLGSSTALIQEGVNGCVVPEKDVEALAAALSSLLGAAPVTRESVLRSFQEIQGYDHQAEQLSRAVAFVTGRS